MWHLFVKNFLFCFYRSFSMIQNWSMLILLHARKQMQNMSKSSSFSAWALAENTGFWEWWSKACANVAPKQGLHYREAVPCTKAALPLWEERRFQEACQKSFLWRRSNTCLSLCICGVSISKVNFWTLFHLLPQLLCHHVNKRQGHWRVQKLSSLL